MNYPNGPKSEWLKQAEEILNGKVSLGKAETHNLLEWLRDYNWPGAKEIARFLIAYEDELVEPVRKILESDDYVWIYWIIVTLISRWDRKTCFLIADELKEIAYGHDEEGAHIEALSICAKKQLDSSDSIREAIKRKVKSDKENFEDYQEILSLL